MRIELAGHRAQIRDRLATGTPVSEVPESEPHLTGRLEPRFGCQSYSAASEYGADWGKDGTITGHLTRTVKVTLTTGEVVEVQVCDKCGSGATRDGKDYLDRRSYCEACKRSHRDGEISKLKRE